MKMTRQEAIDMFGSHLYVGDNYTHITEELGDYKTARRGGTVDDDNFVSWVFPNDDAGLIAAKEYAFENRSMDRTGRAKDGSKAPGSRWSRSIEQRQEVLDCLPTRIRLTRAKIASMWGGGQTFLANYDKYVAETEELRQKESEDDVNNVKVTRLSDVLEVGTVHPIGTTIYEVYKGYDGVEVREYVVTSHSVYGWNSKDGVDVTIHSNFGEPGAKQAKGHISNEPKTKQGFSNRAEFADREAAYALAKEWAQEAIAKAQAIIDQAEKYL